MTQCPEDSRIEDCPDCARLPECCAPVPTIIEVKLAPVHHVYRYTIAMVDDILDELYYTGDIRNGSFWEFFHTEEDRLLSVKVDDIRYVEKVKVDK